VCTVYIDSSFLEMTFYSTLLDILQYFLTCALLHNISICSICIGVAFFKRARILLVNIIKQDLYSSLVFSFVTNVNKGALGD